MNITRNCNGKTWRRGGAVPRGSSQAFWGRAVLRARPHSENAIELQGKGEWCQRSSFFRGESPSSISGKPSGVKREHGTYKPCEGVLGNTKRDKKRIGYFRIEEPDLRVNRARAKIEQSKITHLGRA